MIRRILIADDEPVICLVFREILALEPWNVTTVDNGQGAINLLCGACFDVAVLDFVGVSHLCYVGSNKSGGG